MQLRPDLVLVRIRPATDHRVSDGGLTMVETYRPETAGRVVQVGARVRDVVPGDAVVFPAAVGEEVEIEGQTHLLMREADILGVIEQRKVS